jgi:hypothetical protein
MDTAGFGSEDIISEGMRDEEGEGEVFCVTSTSCNIEQERLIGSERR